MQYTYASEEIIFDDDFEKPDGWEFVADTRDVEGSFNAYSLGFVDGKFGTAAQIKGDGYSTVAGMQKSLDIEPSLGKSLILSFDYKATSSSSDFVTTARVSVFDDTGKRIFYDVVETPKRNTGWLHYSTDLTKTLQGIHKASIFLHLVDNWAADWDQQVFYDNAKLAYVSDVTVESSGFENDFPDMPLVGKASVVSQTNVHDGRQHHVVFMRDSDEHLLKLFVDGVLESSADVSQLGSISQDSIGIDIGNTGPPNLSTAPFDGQLDQIRIYNRTLDVSEVQLLLTERSIPSKGLVAEWLFENNFDDTSGNGHDTTSIGTYFSTSRFGKGLSFDGIDGIARIQPSTQLQFGDNSFTVSFWIRLDNQSHGGHLILDKRNNDSDYVGWISSVDDVVQVILRDHDAKRLENKNPEQPIHSIILPSDIIEKTFDEFMEWCMPFYGEKCTELYRGTSVLPPLKQSHLGHSFDEIQCKDDLVLIQKYDGSPSCVTESAISKLIDRGWAKSHKNPLQIIIPYGASNSSDSNFILQYDHFKSGNFIEITNQDDVSYDITGEHIPQTESFSFHIQIEPDESWKNQIISNYDVQLTAKDLVTGKPFAWMNKTIHVQPRIAPELPSDYPPEPETNDTKYRLDMCSYYDDNGKHRYCMLEGWNKPASELDCKDICRPPPTKDGW